MFKPDVSKVKEVVYKYCNQNGICVNKLRTQRTQLIDGKVYYLQDNGVSPDGLRNDLATMPYPTLIVNTDYSVSETEYTDKYLR